MAAADTNSPDYKSVTDSNAGKPSGAGVEVSLPDLLNSLYKGFANDIKTPVNAIVGFSNLLAEQGITAEARKKFLDIILNSSDELLYIVNNFSELACLEDNLKKTEKNVINIASELKELEENFASQAKLKKLKFSVSVPDSQDEDVVITDSRKLKQILNSLVYNAFKLFYSNVVELAYNRTGNNMDFILSDGNSARDAKREKILLVNYLQGNNLFATGKVGIDSGIFLACRYAEHLGGNIWISAGDGDSTVIYLTLPGGVQHSEKENEKADDQKHSASETTKKIVLVAEDDDNNYPLIENIFLKMNLKVIRAVNGREVVEICRSQHVDLIFLDVKMPVMDGYTAARIVLESKPDMKIIAQTAYFGDREHALKNGCIDFIAKPFSKKQVTDIVMKYL